MADARRRIGIWRGTYNAARPRADLAGRTPDEFARQRAASPK